MSFSIKLHFSIDYLTIFCIFFFFILMHYISQYLTKINNIPTIRYKNILSKIKIFYNEYNEAHLFFIDILSAIQYNKIIIYDSFLWP